MILISDKLRPQLIDNGQDTENDHVPLVKLFDPSGAAMWLISAIEPDDPDILFGLCDLGLGFPELGSVRQRIELEGFTDETVDRFKALGLKSEIISWKLRLFVPVGDNGAAILAKVMERHSLVCMTNREGGSR